MKYVLKDEIVYLFQDEYEEYKKCIAFINQINKDTNKNFWDIILSIIKIYCINKSIKIYIHIRPI